MLLCKSYFEKLSAQSTQLDIFAHFNSRIASPFSRGSPTVNIHTEIRYFRERTAFHPFSLFVCGTAYPNWIWRNWKIHFRKRKYTKCHRMIDSSNGNFKRKIEKRWYGKNMLEMRIQFVFFWLEFRKRFATSFCCLFSYTRFMRKLNWVLWK